MIPDELAAATTRVSAVRPQPRELPCQRQPGPVNSGQSTGDGGSPEWWPGASSSASASHWWSPDREQRPPLPGGTGVTGFASVPQTRLLDTRTGVGTGAASKPRAVQFLPPASRLLGNLTSNVGYAIVP